MQFWIWFISWNWAFNSRAGFLCFFCEVYNIFGGRVFFYQLFEERLLCFGAGVVVDIIDLLLITNLLLEFSQGLEERSLAKGFCFWLAICFHIVSFADFFGVACVNGNWGLLVTKKWPLLVERNNLFIFYGREIERFRIHNIFIFLLCHDSKL